MTTRWHRLEGTVERYIILQGEGSVEMDDMPASRVGPGDVVIIPPLCPQRITNTGVDDLVFLAVCTPRFKLSVYRDIDE